MEENSSSGAIRARFSGTAGEYFGIWIVNFLLSIVTFGIYSAWAKVRNRKYFLGNTTIDGRPFEYHARDLQILFGRAIVVGALVILSVSSSISPILNGVVFVLLAAALPWLINRGLRFNAAMTSWSNVRFRFEGSYWRAFAVFLLYPFLAIFSLYLAFPFVARASSRYTIGRHSLGGYRFAFESGIGPFYRAFLWAAAWVIAVLAVSAGLALTAGLLDGVGRAIRLGNDADGVIGVAIVAGYLAGAVAFLPLMTIYRAFVRNAVYAGIALEGGHRFESTISPPRLIWIAISNAAVIVVSFGMLLPWARVRVARYLCSHTWVEPASSLDEFIGEAESRQSAIGDAFMDIEGVDVGAAV